MNTSNEARFAPELIKARLDEFRNELAKLREAKNVRVLAANKTVPADVINYAVSTLGIDLIGENRVQELLQKYDDLTRDPSRPELHIIGTLQTNKVKYIIDKVDMIESVDSEKLAAEIDRQAKKYNKVMDILIEVNIGREENKSGILPEELYTLIGRLHDYQYLRLRGLMTIAPVCSDRSDYIRYFSQTRDYFDSIRNGSAKSEILSCEDSALPDLSAFDTLSMGMSASWREAVLCGATEIRLGSTIFGERPKPVE